MVLSIFSLLTMPCLEQQKVGTRVQGVDADEVATFNSARFYGDQNLDRLGKSQQWMFYRCDKNALILVEVGGGWSFDGDGDLCGSCSWSKPLWRSRRNRKGSAGSTPLLDRRDGRQGI